MIHQPQPSFDVAEQAALAEINRRLRTQGWGVTVAWMLAEWHELSLSVDGYDLSIDDYTNDLTARDGLERALAQCPQPLRAKLASWIEVADREFIARTQDDFDGSLGHFCDVDEAAGWWWKRRPANGPLAEFLSTTRSRS